MENYNFTTCALITLLSITLLQHKELHAKTKFKDATKMNFRITVIWGCKYSSGISVTVANICITHVVGFSLDWVNFLHSGSCCAVFGFVNKTVLADNTSYH